MSDLDSEGNFYSEDEYSEESFESLNNTPQASPKMKPSLPTSNWAEREETKVLGIESLNDIIASVDDYQESGSNNNNANNGASAYANASTTKSKGNNPTTTTLRSSFQKQEDNVKGMSDLDDLLSHLDQFEVPAEKSAPAEVIEASKASTNASALMKWKKKSTGEEVGVNEKRVDWPSIEKKTTGANNASVVCRPSEQSDEQYY